MRCHSWINELYFDIFIESFSKILFLCVFQNKMFIVLAPVLKNTPLWDDEVAIWLK